MCFACALQGCSADKACMLPRRSIMVMQAWGSPTLGVDMLLFSVLLFAILLTRQSDELQQQVP